MYLAGEEGSLSCWLVLFTVRPLPRSSFLILLHRSRQLSIGLNKKSFIVKIEGEEVFMHSANGKGRIVLLPVMCAMLMFASLAHPASAQGFYIRGVDPSRGAPGMEARVYGGGATSNGVVEAFLVDIYGERNTTLGSTVADTEGYWEIIFTVPDVTPGYYTVVAVDKETSTGAVWGFEVFEVKIKITYVSPSTGPPGTLVYLSGGGATPAGEVRVYFDETSVANTTADMGGYWYVSGFKVPQVAPGNYTITALDVTSNTTDTWMFTVTPPPTIHVSPQQGPIGSNITVSGESFSPGQYYVGFEDLMFFSPIFIIDVNGKFNVTLFVPIVNSGNYTVRAVAITAYGFNEVANTSFTVTIGLDTLFDKIDDLETALNQTRTTAQSAVTMATAAKEAAARAEAMAGEARTYALAAMIFSIIAAVSSLTVLLRKKA